MLAKMEATPPPFDASKIALEIQGPPEYPGVPHRFNDPCGSPHAFPHAIVASKQRQGEHEYQLDITRKTTLSMKFNKLPEGENPSHDAWTALRLEPSLEIEDKGRWRQATSDDFPDRTVHPMVSTPGLFKHKPLWHFPSPLELTVKLQLNVLSSQTYPKHQRLRFKVEGSISEADIPSFFKQSCTGSIHVVAHSVPFVSVAKTISDKEASKERVDPRPLSGHAHETKQKRAASRRAAQAVHEKRFATVKDALDDAEFAGATRRLVDKALKGLRQAVGTSSEQNAESGGEESEGEESEGEESADEEDEHEYAEEESDADPQPEPSLPVQPSSEKLSEIRSESIALLGTLGLHERRKQIVEVLFTETVEVQQGLEGKGIDLSRVEDARPACLFGSVDNVLDAALQEYAAIVYTDVLNDGGVVGQKTMDIAAATLKSRLYDSTIVSGLKASVSRTKERLKEVGMLWQCHHDTHKLRTQERTLNDELTVKESRLNQLSAPASLHSFLNFASRSIDNAITLVKDPPVDIYKWRMLLINCGIFSETTDIIQHALRATSAPMSTNAHWRSFQFKAKRVHNDTRCDASFLAGTLDEEDIAALQRAVAFLRRLTDDCKSASEMPLAASPVPVDAPLDSVPFAQAQPVDASNHSLIYLPPIDVIDNSSASALLIPNALLLLPAEYRLRFVAENIPLPPTPRGSKLLAERALPDVLRLLDGFLAYRGEDSSNCPFRAVGEMDEASLYLLKWNVKAAARLLRGESVEEEAAASASADTQAASRGTITPKESGVVCNKEETRFVARITYTVTFDGKEYESTLDNESDQLMLGRAPSEEACDSWCNDLSNQRAAYNQARTKLRELETEAKNRAHSKLAKAQHDRWEAMKGKLFCFLTRPREEDSMELTALRNAAGALANCSVHPYEGWLSMCSSLPRHSRDSKRAEKTYDGVIPQEAPIQLSKETIQGGSTGMQIKPYKAERVLKSIAERAGLKVKDYQNNPSTMYLEGSKAKGRRTTKRHRFIEICSFDDLKKVANVVSGAIDVFMDKTRSKEQKAWLVKRACGKRKRA